MGTLRLAVATALCMSAAAAAEECPGPPEEVWPDNRPHHLHLVTYGTIGACARPSSTVAASGPCGEAGLGTEVSFSHRHRLVFETGAGFVRSRVSFDPVTGVTTTSGGPGYVAFRVMWGLDFHALFFMHLGAQLKIPWERPTLGAQIPIDLGTRIGHFLELGVRSYVGFDGVYASQTPKWSATPSFGAQAFVRVFIL